MLNQTFAEFKQFYTRFSDVELGRLDAIYSKDVVFTDPIHTVHGREALHHYFSDIAGNLKSCRFEFLDELVVNGSAYIKWDMHFAHPRISRGEIVTMRGVTQLEFDDTGITYHEDFYDMGAMIYEHIPFVGRVIRWIKNNLSGSKA